MHRVRKSLTVVIAVLVALSMVFSMTPVSTLADVVTEEMGEEPTADARRGSGAQPKAQEGALAPEAEMAGEPGASDADSSALTTEPQEGQPATEGEMVVDPGANDARDPEASAELQEGVLAAEGEVVLSTQQEPWYEPYTGTIYDVFRRIITAAANESSVSYNSTTGKIGGIYYPKAYFLADISGDSTQELFIRRNAVNAFDVIWYDPGARKAAVVGTVSYWRANLYYGWDGHSIYNTYQMNTAYLGKVTLDGIWLNEVDVCNGGSQSRKINQLCGAYISPTPLSDLSLLSTLVAPDSSWYSGYTPGIRPFYDVPTYAWYAEPVTRAASLGIISGYASGGFGPNNIITRGQVAAILWNYAGKPGPKGTPKYFPDVSSGKYYYDAVRWASSVGVVSGYDNGWYGTADPVTREQLATMLANYASKVGNRYVSGSFWDYYYETNDWWDVSDWAEESMGWCFRNGIISGTDDGYLCPKRGTTRAETAKMVVYLRDVFRQ